MTYPIVSRNEAKKLGYKHYFTGKTCPNGHTELRWVSSYACVVCADEHKKRYRCDPEFYAREMAYKAKYRDENREKVNQYARDRWANTPGARFDNFLWKHLHRDEINERQRVANLSEEQKAKLKVHRKNSYQRNRENFLHRSKVATARRKGAEGKYTREDVDRILKAQKYKCAGCKTDIRESYHIDHIKPISKGGSNWPKNLQCLCPPCNMTKSALDPIDWAKRVGRLL